MKLCLFLSLFCVALFSASKSHAVELKIATLAPEGTSMQKKLAEMASEVATKTGNRVTFKIFAGAVQGDEKDVVRKMRYGQIDGAALTGVGLGLIDPQIRVLEVPFLFNNALEVDKVYSQLRSFFVQEFHKKGFELLGWAEIGFVKIFSNKPVRRKDDLKGLKMWMWEGDPLAKEMYAALNVTPVPLVVTDVLTSLQTKLIDAVYAPELGAIAFQWHTKTKYMTDINLVNGTGGILLTSQAWNKVSGGDHGIIQQVIDQKAKELVQQTRADNEQSKQAIQSLGIEVVTPDEQSLQEMRTIGKDVRERLVGQLYSQDLLNKVLSLIN